MASSKSSDSLQSQSIHLMNRDQGVLAVLQKRMNQNMKINERVRELDTKLTSFNSDLDQMYNTLKTRLEGGNDSTSSAFSLSLPSQARSQRSGSTFSGHSTLLNDSKSTEDSQTNVDGRVTILEKNIFSIQKNLERISQQLTSGNPRNKVAQNESSEKLYGCQEICNVFQQSSEDLLRASETLNTLYNMPAVYALSKEGISGREEVSRLRDHLFEFSRRLKKSLKVLRRESLLSASNEDCIVCG